MSKYIAVDDLKVCVDILADKMTDSGATAIKQAINIADSLPSIEIVRCKDCKKAKTKDCERAFYDDHIGEWFVDYRGDDWFCAVGEPKESE